MPALSYPTGDFVPFTKILSSEVNGKFNAIKTLLNTTLLDYQNVQVAGLKYNNMTITTSLQLVGTDSSGVMTTQAFALTRQGGFGFAYTPTTLDVAKVLQINTAGTSLTFDTTPQPPTSKIYSWYRFG